MSKEKLFEMARINKDHAEKGTMTLVDDVVKIPAENYYNPERWKKEVDLIFKRLPLVLSVTGEIPNPGDYKAMEVVGVPVIILRNKKGKIINISSIIGLTGNTGQSNYAASKAGIIGLTKSIAKEFASRNITVNAIAPGYIETDMTDNLNDKSKMEFIQKIPLKKLGSTQDVSDLVLFLCSKHANYITGQTITIDGGLTI